jgi:hypothetical protein
MKTYAYELSPEDQKRFFFESWYRSPKVKYTRILAGPLCLALGILCIVFEVGWVYVAVGIAMILAGLYYGLQPLVTFRRGGREGLAAVLTVASDELRYEDAKSRTVIPRSLIASISIKGDILFIGVKADKLSYVPFDLRRIADREEFLDKLRRMAGA